MRFCAKMIYVQKICGSGSVVERHLAKVNVASSNLVFRSNNRERRIFFKKFAPFILIYH